MVNGDYGDSEKKGHKFGEELLEVASLFQSRSAVAGKHLADMLILLLGISSVQTTLPVPCVLPLQALVREKSLNLSEKFTTEHRTVFDSYMGQPLLSLVLDNLVHQMDIALTMADRKRVEKDCDKVLNFLSFVSDIVKYSHPATDGIRDRVFEKAQKLWHEGFGAFSASSETDESASDPAALYDALAFWNAGEQFSASLPFQVA
jgi:hypothetical protein